jgi:predicted phage tail protein
MSAIPETNAKVVRLVVESKPKEFKMSSTLQKILRVAGCILVALGIALMVGGALCIGLGAASVIPAVAVVAVMSCGPTMIPLGISSLLSGCHLFYIAEKRSFSKLKTVNVNDLLDLS